RDRLRAISSSRRALACPSRLDDVGPARVPLMDHGPGPKGPAGLWTYGPMDLYPPAMNRRDFLKAAGATLAVGSIPRYAEALADTHKRVGLIGTGWYGKADLFRLIQVAPVEVVSLCDADKRMLADAASQVASRQVSKKTPRTFSDYREMLRQK